MAEPSPEDDKESQLTTAGCLLAAVSAIVVFGVALPVVTWRDPVSGHPLPRRIAIVLPVLAGAVCNGIGTAILWMLGLRVFAKSINESIDHLGDVDASEADTQG